MGPARVPTQINSPWTHFSGKEIRVRGGPETQVVWAKFLTEGLLAMVLTRLRGILLISSLKR